MFCSDIESICYSSKDVNNVEFSLRIGKDIILCEVLAIEENQAMIKLNLISNLCPLFDFSGSTLLSKAVRSNLLSLDIDDFKNGIRMLIT